MTEYHSPKKVLVILVNWKRPLDTICCIRSLLQTNIPIDLFVCENASPDSSLQEIVEFANSFPPSSCSRRHEPPTVTRAIQCSWGISNLAIFPSGKNLGFAGGNNSAFFSTSTLDSYSHFWFLNNDTEVPPNCLSEMLRKFDHPTKKIGIVGSTMVYFHDKKTVQALGGSVYKPWSGTMREIGNGLTWPCEVDEAEIESKMSYVCGASMLVSAELIRDVGLMRDDYFLFFEEIDWCERARKAGYSLAYASKAVVYHKEGAAIGTGTGATRSSLAEYYGMRNKLLVTWRFFPWAFPTVWLISWLQVARRFMQKRPGNAWIMAKVLFGFGNRPN